MIKKLQISNGAATNSLLLMAVSIITTLLGLIITKLLSVHFSLSEYGTYSQALLVTSTATSLSILGLTNATNYFYNRSDSDGEKRSYLATIFFIEYISGSVAALIIILSRVKISEYFSNDKLGNILLLVALTPILTNLINMYQTLFVSIGQAKKIAVRNFVVSVIKLFAVIIACFALNNIVVVLIIVLITDIAQVIYFSLVFKKEQYAIKLRDKNIGLIKEILAFSVPMAIYVLSNSLSRDIDKYVVSIFADTETLAIYSNAAKILPFDLLTTSIVTVLIPIITRLIHQKAYDEARNIFKLYLQLGYLLTGIFVGGAIALAAYLMPFLYDKKYLSGLPIFIIYLFVDLIRFANVTTILSGAGKTKILMRISLIVLALNAVFNIVGYKCLGIVGPAIVTLVLTIMMTLALLYYGSKEIKTRILDLFDLKEMLCVGIEIVVIGVVTNHIASLLSKHNVPLFFVLAISYGIYLLVLFGINFKKVLRCLKKLNTYK